jgi:hypothetical protein
VGDIYSSISVFRLVVGGEYGAGSKVRKAPTSPRKKVRNAGQDDDDDGDGDDEEKEVKLVFVTKLYLPPWPVTIQSMGKNCIIGNDVSISFLNHV